jgi:peptidoglycan/LPS O-acetylase OafA/YrhL
MIQRLQSIFIFLFVLTSFLAYIYLPEKQFFVLDLNSIKVDFYSFILIFGVVFGLVTFFMFKNRNRQLLFTKILIACQLFLIISSIYNFFHFNYSLYKDLSIFIIVIGLIFLLFGYKYIKKDIDLINSIDRIR